MSNSLLSIAKGLACGAIFSSVATILMGGTVPGLWWAFTAIVSVLSIIGMLTVECRWKDASYLTRLVRWCVYRPWYFLEFCGWMFDWGVRGFKPISYPPDPEFKFPGLYFTRLQTIEHYWEISRSMSDYACQNFVTLEEIRGE